MSCGLLLPIIPGEGVNAEGSTEGRLLVVVREPLSTCQGVTYFESSREMGFGLASERSREGRPSEISVEY